MSEEVLRRLQTINDLVAPLADNAKIQCTIVTELRDNVELGRAEAQDLAGQLAEKRIEAAADFDTLLGYLLENFHGEPDRQQFKEARSRDMFSADVFCELPQNLIPLLVTTHLLYNLRLKFPYQNVTLWPTFTKRYYSVILDLG
jgi:hypothetical protein